MRAAATTTTTMVALIAATVVSHCDLAHSSLIKRRDYSQEGATVLLPTYLEEEIRSTAAEGYRVAGGSGRQMKITDLSWRNCGPEDDGFKLRRLDFDPEVIRLPGTVKSTYAASLMEDEAAPIHLQTVMYRKLAFFWVKLPCETIGEEAIGTCFYPDICKKLSRQGLIPLHCPFQKGVYANTTTARVDAVPDLLPDWLLSGKYWVRADAWDGNGGKRLRHVACLQFDFMLS